jgi:hypothetical protein
VPQHPAQADEPEDHAASPKELAMFVVRAVRQNALLSAFVVLVTGALGIAIVAALPKYYEATSKIFIQEGGSVTGSLTSGHERFHSTEAARGLEEFILARDNLLSIVREAKLVEKWPRTRPWPMALKDRITEYLVGPPDPRWMERGFVEMLTASITAAKDGESVRITAQWRDRESAYDIARLVVRNFLAARAAADHGPIQRAIPFLEQELLEADQEIERAVSRVQAARANTGGGTASVDSSQALAPAPSGPTPEMQNLSRRLSEVRRQQRELTEPQRSKLAELKMQMIEMRASYSADHPLIRQQEARIAKMSEVPPELTELRDEEARIVSALSSRGAKDIGRQKESAAKASPVDDAELAAAQARLGSMLRKSDDAMAKLESARIELATAEADFKHRYVVIEEPEVPDAPLKAKKQPMFFAVAIVVALLLGAAAGALRELRKGQLVELWQVRQLGLELLGEVDLK